MRLTVSCPKCRADQPELRVRSQTVVCWRCGAMARLRVERVRDELKVTIIPVEPAAARTVKP